MDNKNKSTNQTPAAVGNVLEMIDAFLTQEEIIASNKRAELIGKSCREKLSKEKIKNE